MKKYFYYFCFGWLLFSLWHCQSAREDQLPSENTATDFAEFSLHKGTNISHWLSQSDRRGEARKNFFLEKDVAYLADLGFDHLRIPIDEEQMFDEQGNKEAEAFGLLHQALDWCRQHGLRAIVDLHILRSHHFNEQEKPLWTDPAAQEKFLQLWRLLSDELKQYPTGMLGYELMNEPVADDPEEWNQLVARAVQALRQQESERTIVIGSNRWQSAATFDQLKVPAGDPHILLSFHFYEPFLLTHYHASWTALADYQGPVHYPGMMVTREDLSKMSKAQAQQAAAWSRVYTRDTLEQMMQKPMAVAKALDLPLYCGEWGVISQAPAEDRLRWYEDMVAIFEKNNIAYANWDYKSGSFGLVNDQGQPQQDLVDIIAR